MRRLQCWCDWLVGRIATETLVDNAAGLVYPDGDRRKLKDCLMRLIDDDGLRQRLGEAGRALAVQRFEQSTVVARYVAHWAERCTVGIPA